MVDRGLRLHCTVCAEQLQHARLGQFCTNFGYLCIATLSRRCRRDEPSWLGLAAGRYNPPRTRRVWGQDSQRQWLEAGMPRTSRGRRPASSQKKRSQRRGPRALAPTHPSAAAQYGAAEAVGAVPSAPAARAAAPSAVLRRQAAPIPRRRFAETVADYSYVVGDLRRIGILASALVVLLVGLSFLIR